MAFPISSRFRTPTDLAKQRPFIWHPNHCDSFCFLRTGDICLARTFVKNSDARLYQAFKLSPSRAFNEKISVRFSDIASEASFSGKRASKSSNKHALRFRTGTWKHPSVRRILAPCQTKVRTRKLPGLLWAFWPEPRPSTCGTPDLHFHLEKYLRPSDSWRRRSRSG